MTRDRAPSMHGAAIPFVLRLGITGHRDPSDVPAVSASTMSSILAVTALFGNAGHRRARGVRAVPTTPLRLRIVSALAEGADRIAVDAAFEAAPRSAPGAGQSSSSSWTGELSAVIPYDIATYRDHDCGSEPSRQEFDRLIGLDPKPRTLHRGRPVDETQRDHWYRDVGHHVADRCDVLIALWDGSDNGKPAGTAATVNYALGHGTPVLWVPTGRVSSHRIERPPGCRAIEPQMILRRWRGDPGSQQGHPLDGDELATVLTRYFRQVKRRSDFMERLRRLEEYNRFLHAEPRTTPPAAAPTGNGSAPAPTSGPETCRREVAAWFTPKRAAAEELADHYQRWFRRTDVSVYFLTVAAVTLGAMSLLFNSWAPVAFEAAVLVLLLGVTVFNVRQIFHDRWIAYRSISEYLRSSQFTCFVAPRSSDGHPDGEPLIERSLARSRIVPWFAPVVEDIWDQRPELRLSAADLPWIQAMLRTDWVGDQRAWHADKSKLHDEWSIRYKRAIGAVFGLSVFIVAVHTVRSIGSSLGERHYHLEFSDGVLAIIVIGLASTGAALNGLAAHANHAGHAERYSDVAYELEQEQKEIESATSMTQLRTSAAAVRRIMLGETNAWFEGMSSSEIEVPT